MEEDFYINVKPEKLLHYENGDVIGFICCQYGTKFFPEDVWDDFVVIILDWWIQAALRLVTQSSDEEKLLFMDGPFAMFIERLDNSQCEMTWVDTQQDGEKFSFTIPFNRFLEQLTKAVDLVINKCQKEKWKSDDLNSLVKDYKMLASAMSSKH
jgi:hypothetical protein